MNATDQTETIKATTGYRRYQGGYFKVLIAPETTQGNMALLEMALPKGAEPPPHIHTREDESFYLQEGEIIFYIGDKTIHARAGDAVYAPRRIAHHFKIQSASAKFLNLITPGNLLYYFLEFSEPETGAVPVIAPQGPPSAERIEKMMGQLMGTYGIEAP